ncbi:DNA cytosine methyltransferase [Burkholderia multivorans]|uniref:DNA cytosine methyltransferase n=1 Tax=Burkholderia multivorans TaxID=87883 RepID=UPI0020B1EE49|nr:DNA cytosine methyltransferase [Burkholderia multivorans]
MTFRFGSVCSGIEAASCAWHPLGWRAAFVSEIEPFPCAVLAHHYPTVPNLGDMTKFKEWPDAAIDLLVGGTPCQSFSVAGLRKGLADPRGNLMLTYLAIAERYAPRWLVWENVPGVLSSNGGRDFGTFLGGLAELGYGFAYRVLDAQYFGIPQRRRRVFVVGHLGDWRRAAAVLFERESLLGHPAPRRLSGQGIAPTLSARTRGGGGLGTDIAFDCKASGQNGFGVGEIASTMRSMGHSASHQNGGGHLAVAVNIRGREGGGTAELSGDVATALRASQGGGDKLHAMVGAAVRRLTPRECERLQGFRDDYTLITVRGKPAADGPRYKALGNSMAVPVMHWIGKRIELVESLTT